MAPLDQYLMPDKDAEVALARSAAPASISDGAEVMVLGRQGYTTAVKGGNGFLCIVKRSWGAATGEPEFWNPKVRAPICFNPPAARAFVPIFLMKTKLVLAGESKTKIVQATASCLRVRRLMNMPPRLNPRIAPSRAAVNMVLGEDPLVPRDKRTEVYAMARVQKASRTYMTLTSQGK